KLIETFESLGSNLESSSQEIGQAAKQVGGLVDERREEVAVWSEQVAGGLKALSSDSNALLVGKFREDKSTGQTPQKRAWKMPGRWALVSANREDAIEAGRKVKDTLQRFDSIVAASDEVLSSETDDVEPFSEATAEEQAAAEAVEVDDQAEAQPPVQTEASVVTPQEPARMSSRPLRELPFSHSNLPVSASNEDLIPIKQVDAATATATALPKTRSAKNKMSATALPISKRARS
ncbi:hypothetical protein, partial [Sporisorium scitamineum]